MANMIRLVRIGRKNVAKSLFQTRLARSGLAGVLNKAIYGQQRQISTSRLNFQGFNNTTNLRDTLLDLTKSKTCTSCGIALQTSNERKAGFIDERVFVEKEPEFRKQSDITYNAVYDSLTEEERRLLMNAGEEEQKSVGNGEEEQGLVKDRKVTDGVNGINETNEINDVKCLRCYNALHHNEYFDVTQNTTRLSSLIDKARIPEFERSVVYHVVSANDFPHTLNLGLLESVKSFRQVRFVINKADLLINHESYVNKFGLEYFTLVLNKFLQTQYDAGKVDKPVQITADQVILVSATKSWNVARLYNTLPSYEKVFFIGEANVGKSSLIKSLLVYDYYLKTRETKDFKLFLGKNAATIKKHVSLPGTFVLPGTTQDILTYKIKNDKVVINDLPGYFKESTGLYNLLKPSWVKHLSKAESEKYQKSLHKSLQNMKKSKYISLTGKDCYTFGGLFFLSGPEHSITQVYTNMNHKGYQFRDVSRALEAIRAAPAALLPYIALENAQKTLAQDNLHRYVIPPFFGAVDLVIKGLGYITITPTRGLSSLKTASGAEENPDSSVKQKMVDLVNYNLYEIYAPLEMEFYIRESIDPYLAKRTLVRTPKLKEQIKYDKQEKKLKKKTVGSIDWTRSTKKINFNAKLYTKLYPVPETTENVNSWFLETHLKGKKLDYIQETDPHTGKLREEFANLSWRDIEKELFKLNVNNLFWNEPVDL